eukprot:4234518-Amphidinium_carterae.1
MTPTHGSINVDRPLPTGCMASSIAVLMTSCSGISGFLNHIRLGLVIHSKGFCCNLHTTNSGLPATNILDHWHFGKEPLADALHFLTTAPAHQVLCVCPVPTCSQHVACHQA